ncbi:MG2 domain-containing protein [Deinococcus sp.]|uniref:alpha-2-macroglobulin family protein n=1 Tax=Deinococcus sp. TaxID=47478 RepID=UPI002869A9CE|nr:MG2 domain-containing protein [Deinococcus sp.]
MKTRTKSLWLTGALLSGLLLADVAPAQQVSIYGGRFESGEALKVEAYGPVGTRFTLERVVDPAGLFAASKDPHSPVVPAGGRTVRVATATLSRADTLNFGRVASGVYLVRAGRISRVVIVTRLGLVVKRDDATTLVYAADRDSGQTRAARIWALGHDSATADAQGLLKWKGTLDKEQVFLAQYGQDWAVSGSAWNSYAAPKVRGYVYTDRPVYRPGHHVDFKGVLRAAGDLKPLAGTAVSVKVLNENDEEIFRRALTTDAAGTVHAGFDLSAGAKVGGYRFVVMSGAYDPGELSVDGSFMVEAYQKPEYAVTVTPSRASAVQGDKVSVKVGAKYLFGGSVSGAKVNYSVTRAPYYPPGFDTDSLPPDAQGQDYGSDLVVQEEARLDKNGELVLELPLARDEGGQPVSYRIEAEVEDETRKTVSGQGRVIAFPAALNVQAETDGYVYAPGDRVAVSLDTRDLGEVGRAAPVTVDLVRQDWQYVQRKWVFREQRVARQTVTTGANGIGHATLNAPRSGGYVVRSTVRDAQGRASTTENWLWITRPGDDWGWNYREISLTLDHKSYKPGDTAKVLIGNPTPGAPVLVSVEGQRLRQWAVLRGAGATLTYTFKVTADMTPNAFVAAASLGGGNFHSAEKTLRVPRVGADLNVSVMPNKALYAPGEAGKLNVQVTDASGRGVSADVALGVVDQAIYLVEPDLSPTMLKVYDAPRDNAVGTQASVDYYFEQTGPVASRPNAPMTTAAFAQSKEAARADTSPKEVTPRQDFRDTLLWVPNLLTDDQGRATVDVTYPDNLTTWITTARAQTALPRFGQTTASTLVTKDVIARVSLPAFLVRGDQVTLSGVVNNTLSTAQDGRATLALSGLSAVRGNALTPTGTAFHVDATGRARVDSVVRATQPGTASVTFAARTPGGGDAVKLPLPVKARGYDETRTVAGSAGTPTTFTVPRDAAAQTVSLSLSLTPSLLSAVAPALDYLVGYPYGCTEQTMSRFLPALLAGQALGAGVLPDSGQNLKAITEASLARLADFQHEDGGWNFWQNDESTLEMTAYVAGGLMRAKSVGAPVSNAVLDHGLKYLAAHVTDPQERQAERATAYRVLADAGRVNVAALSAFARRKELTPYSLAQLSLALDRAGQRQAAQDTLSRLKAARQSTNQGVLVYWGSTRPADDWWWFWDDNKVQVTAVALEALARLEPSSPLIPGVSQWLLHNRQGPRWVSTQDTTSVIIAALSLPKVATAGPSAVDVSVDGQAIQTVQIGAQKGATLDVPAPLLTAGSHSITLKGAPAGLTYSGQLRYSREPATLNAITGRGIALGRTYERLDAQWDAQNKRYTYARTPLLRGGQLQPVTVGDLILVTLSVKPDQTARYMLVSDPIPAGMKALDERSLNIAGLKERDEYDWETWDYWYAGRDLLDDRVDLYADYLEGRQSMTYVLRAQTPGTFTALPSHAFLMYDPGVEGYGPAATITVRDR